MSLRLSYLLWHLQRNEGNIRVKVLKKTLKRLNYIKTLCKKRSTRSTLKVCHTISSSGHLVNGESDGEEVGAHLALFPPVLLHQSHHEGAAHLVVLGIVVLLQQTKAVLRVGPEGVCGTFHFVLNERFPALFFDALDGTCRVRRGTWVVPAAPRGAALHPATLVHRNRPLVDLVVLQGVGGEVTDLDLGVVLLKVLERHPGEDDDSHI